MTSSMRYASLKEETWTVCFQVNDDLCKILDDVEHPENVHAFVESQSSKSTTVSSSTGANDKKETASASAMGNNDVEDMFDSLDFDSFGFEDQKESIASGDRDYNLDYDRKPAAAVAASTLEDLLAPPSKIVQSGTETGTTKVVDVHASSGTKSDPNTTVATKPAANATGEDGDDDFDNFFGERVDKNSFSIDE